MNKTKPTIMRTTIKGSRGKADNDLADAVKREYAQLKGLRTPIDHIYEDCFEYTHPLRGQEFYGNYDGMSNAQSAHSDTAEIYDTTAIDAVRLLTSALKSGTTPSHMRWIYFQLPGVHPDRVPQDIRGWLETAGRIAHQEIHNGNFDAEAYDFYQDITIGGMAGLFTEMKGDTLYHEVWPLQSFYAADSNGLGIIDTVVRPRQYTVLQLANLFGKDKLSDDMLAELKDNPSNPKKHNVIHCIKPRTDSNDVYAKKRVDVERPFASVYVLEADGTILRESGYSTFPVAIPRWNRIMGTCYATGPVFQALPTIKTVNKKQQFLLTHMEEIIAPPFAVKNDGIINPSSFKFGPRQPVFVADTKNIQLLETSGDMRIAEWSIAQDQAAIRRLLMADQLMPTDGPMMTAREVHERSMIQRRQLGPTFERFESEFLRTFCNRVLQLLVESGKIPPPPPMMFEVGIVPEYQSPLARAQRVEDVESMMQFEESIAMSAKVDPSVLDNYDFDKATRRKAEKLGVPADLIMDQETVNERRRARAKAQAEAERQEQMAQMAQQGANR